MDENQNIPPEELTNDELDNSFDEESIKEETEDVKEDESVSNNNDDMEYVAPTDDAPEEEQERFLNGLRPESADDYQLASDGSTEYEQSVASNLQPVLHKCGLSKYQANKLFQEMINSQDEQIHQLYIKSQENVKKFDNAIEGGNEKVENMIKSYASKFLGPKTQDAFMAFLSLNAPAKKLVFDLVKRTGAPKSVRGFTSSKSIDEQIRDIYTKEKEVLGNRNHSRYNEVNNTIYRLIQKKVNNK